MRGAALALHNLMRNCSLTKPQSFKNRTKDGRSPRSDAKLPSSTQESEKRGAQPPRPTI